MNDNNTINSAEILCVGTELLLGDIVNTNAAFLSTRLADLGINVYRHTAVGDNPERLRRALKLAIDENDLVITSGGLGPTYDDLTKETVSDFFGRKMYLHDQSLARIEEYFSRTGRVMTENNKKQAMMPEGAIVFTNNYGTAPALALYDEEKNKTVIMLPGPPNELVPIFNEEVEPYLHSRRESMLISHNVNIFGMGESSVETALKGLMQNAHNPTVAPYCKEGEVRLRVTARASTKEDADRMCEEMIANISATEVGKYIYGVDADTLENAAIKHLKRKGLTLSSAESCTGGLIAKRLTDVAGSSEVFLGGCVTYTNDVKMKLVGVSAETLERYGAVSGETACEMARGVRLALGSDIGVSTTGIAGPGGGTEETPVGTVFVGISTEKGEYVKRLSLSSMKSRSYIRNISANHAFALVLECENNNGKK
ncbi:MAG: competence/damage-inducible protein A [Clostridia bacterium]|nr:competence/damage-inducible protein A [Clostridia bacterium]